MMTMRKEYVDWTKNKRKHATTRLHPKKLGEKYELTTGSRYKPVKTGIIVEINSIFKWSQETLTTKAKEIIYKAEGFQNWKEFWGVIMEINRDKDIRRDTFFYTNFYEMVA